MKMVLRVWICFSLLISATSAQKPAHPKTSVNTAHQLTSLKATGTTRYTDKDILAASGLQIGQNASDGDFKEAVQKLGNSGMFSDMAYSYVSSPSGIKVEITLSDVDRSKLATPRFENFVWFSDEQLRQTVHSLVPLFTDLLPLAGKLTDHVAEALQTTLTDKGLPGHVTYLREAAEAGGPLTAINFRVEDITIHIQEIEFPGASPEQAELLAKAARRIVGAEYSRVSLAAMAKFDLLPIYFQRGYLKAEFDQAEAKVLSSPESAGATDHRDVEVNAILPVKPGKVYSTAAVDWRGNSVITEKELTPLLHLPLGEPADAIRLDRDLEKVADLYHSRGYIMAQIRPEPRLDDEKNTVDYDLNVKEGDLYKMGELEILGLDRQLAARLQSTWKLREGEPFNADYPKQFLADANPLLPRDVRFDISTHVTPDTKDKTVDVEVRFKQE